MPAPKGIGALAAAHGGPAAGLALMEAMTVASGSIGAVAARYGVHRGTVFRWIATLPGEMPGQTCREWVDANYPQAHSTTIKRKP